MIPPCYMETIFSLIELIRLLNVHDNRFVHYQPHTIIEESVCSQQLPILVLA